MAEPKKSKAEEDIEHAREAAKWAEENGDNKTAKVYNTILNWIDET